MFRGSLSRIRQVPPHARLLTTQETRETGDGIFTILSAELEKPLSWEHASIRGYDHFPFSRRPLNNRRWSETGITAMKGNIPKKRFVSTDKHITLQLLKAGKGLHHSIRKMFVPAVLV
eukprot:scaffold52785_cov41-Attheya_sp.AAC.2